MQKILTFTIDSLACDPEDVAAALNEACTHRHEKYWIRGACQLDGKVYFLLLRLPEHKDPEAYRLAFQSDTSEPGVVSVLEQRWETGFDPVASIDLGEGSYLLLVAEPKKRH